MYLSVGIPVLCGLFSERNFLLSRVLNFVNLFNYGSPNYFEIKNRICIILFNSFSVVLSAVPIITALCDLFE